MKKVLIIRFNLFWHFLAFWAGPRNLRKDCGPGRKTFENLDFNGTERESSFKIPIEGASDRR